MSYATPTQQNLSVWARRFGVSFNSLEKAESLADGLYGTPSRRAVLQIVAIKAISEATGKPCTNRGVYFAGLAAGQMLYNAVYDGKTINGHVEIRELLNSWLSDHRITDDDRVAAGFLENLAAQLVFDAIAVREAERNRPSMANLILAQARNPR